MKDFNPGPSSPSSISPWHQEKGTKWEPFLALWVILLCDFGGALQPLLTPVRGASWKAVGQVPLQVGFVELLSWS